MSGPESSLPIAVDAMGGDAAPGPVVAGAVSAARDFAVPVELVGPQALVEQALTAEGDVDRTRVTLVEAPAAVGMGDRPLAALRRGRPTSIRVAVERVRDGQAAGLFSAGHTGATVMAACTELGLLPGVDRPALAVTVPTERGAAVMLDVGATVDCRPEHLLQFAAMGCAYASVALEVAEPAVGLLSIGEEALKGNDLTRDAYRLLEGSGLKFTGNLEARDVFTGKADVIVCDGFTGNVALKVSEGLVSAIESLLEAELAGTLVARLGAVLARGAFKRFRNRVDYSEYGGAPLLGVKGLCVVGHGNSTAKAVRNGIVLTRRFAEAGLVTRIAERVVGLGAGPATARS
jgi:glycerol-3-phosphate acyltransferase PlsX